VALSADGLEVLFIVGPTFTDWDNVVNAIRGTENRRLLFEADLTKVVVSLEPPLPLALPGGGMVIEFPRCLAALDCPWPRVGSMDLTVGLC
jgi:hypothetical protein